MDPCIPKGWKGFTVTRRFRGTVYRITVRNPKGVCKGVSMLMVDGVAVAGNVIPLGPAGRTVEVAADLG